MRKPLLVAILAATAWAAGFAPDQRHLAPNQAPFTSLGRTTAHGGVGCGVLIGPDLVMTCAHCISNPQRQPYDDVEVEFGLGFEQTTHKARMKEAIMLETASSSIESGQDWAIVRLDRPLGVYYGWLKCRYLADAEWQDAELELLGYCSCPDEARPQFGQMDRPYRCPGAVSDVGDQIVFHNCAMWGGTSGAPLLARLGNHYALVGLNFAGVGVENETLEHGFRATYRKELANLAIPARNWREKLNTIPERPGPTLKTVWIENRSARALVLKVTYNSVFADPGAPPSQKEVVVPAKTRLQVLERSLGCADSKLILQVNSQKPIERGLKASECTLTLP